MTEKKQAGHIVRKETHYAYLVLHEGELFSLKKYCEAQEIVYKTVLMRVWRWHKHLPSCYLLFDTALADDREVLSKEHHTIGTPDYAEKTRRKNAATKRIARSDRRRILQVLRDAGIGEDESEPEPGCEVAGKATQRACRSKRESR